jgi:hypothetical protein
MTDSTIIKVPVYKKQSQPKTTEEFAREAANELIKTRKRRLKILRGEYDFHPDGEALKVMSALLSKQEAHYLALFIGTKQTEKKVYSFSIVPQSDNLSKDFGYFSENKGIQENGNGLPITIQLTKEQSVTNTGIVPDKAKNQLYLRIPVQTNISVKLKNEVIASKVIPVYQFGNIQVLPIQ